MSQSGGFTLVDFTVPSRDNTMTHEPTEAPLCDECQAKDLCFFDPTCSGCQDLLLDSNTSISQLFAVMRQWVPQTQRNMSSLSREVLRRGANVNDRDGLTDLSLLHFACKSGAPGVGNVNAALNLVNSLLNKGADSELRCKWTNMNALHYAVFFDVPEIVETLLEYKPALLHSTCDEFDEGTALHIAASNLSITVTQILLKHGANCTLTNRNGHTPLDLVVNSNQTSGFNDGDIVNEMASILKSAAEKMHTKEEENVLVVVEEEEEGESEGGGKGTGQDKENVAMEVEPPVTVTHIEKIMKPLAPQGKPPHSPATAGSNKSGHHQSVSQSSLGVRKTHSPRVREPVRTRGTRSPVSTVSTLSSGSSRAVSPAVDEVTMVTLGLRIGDRVLIDAKTSSKSKNGTIRFGGSTEFAVGQWAGIELEEAIGKNDGSCMGIRYFTCKPKYGLFVPMNRVSKAPPTHLAIERRRKSANGDRGGRKRESIALSPRTFEAAQGAMSFNTDLQVGDRVRVGGTRNGTLRFAGPVKFAPGIWLGVELDNSHGKNDGSHSGVRYFRCKTNHGVFVPPSKVKRLPPPSSSSSGSSSYASSNDSTDHHPTSHAHHHTHQHPHSNTSSSSPSPHASPPINKRRLNTSNSSKAGPRAKQARTVSLSHAPSSAPIHPHLPSLSTSTLSLSSLPNVTLETGMSVFVTGAEFGVVRYIGHTEFSEGVWLGLELRRPNGKNDGTVKGKRYFHCKPSHGLFVRPEKATHRGINCAKILSPPHISTDNTS